MAVSIKSQQDAANDDGMGQMKPKAIAYLRESRHKRGGGVSIDHQRDECSRAARELGLTEILTFEDRGKSGGLEPAERPGLIDALSRLTPGDVLIVYDFSRLARSPAIFVGLEQLIVTTNECRLISATEPGGNDGSPEGELIRWMQVGFAAYFRTVAKTRAKATKARMRRQKLYTGGKKPAGKTVQGGKVVWTHEGLFAARRIQELWGGRKTEKGQQGAIGLERIIEILNKEGIAPLGEAKAWYPTTVGRFAEVDPDEHDLMEGEEEDE